MQPEVDPETGTEWLEWSNSLPFIRTGPAAGSRYPRWLRLRYSERFNPLNSRGVAGSWGTFFWAGASPQISRQGPPMERAPPRPRIRTTQRQLKGNSPHTTPPECTTSHYKAHRQTYQPNQPRRKSEVTQHSRIGNLITTASGERQLKLNGTHTINQSTS